MIHICFGIHDGNGKYSKYMAATICSVIRNTKEKIVFHVLHDDTLNKELRNLLEGMILQYDSADISFYRIDIDEKRFEKYDLKRFTVGTLFKLMICAQLKDFADRVIYLDSDIIVNLDILELWNQDLEGKLIGAVCMPPKVEAIWPLLSKKIIDRQEYFNTGLMVLDIKKINETHKMWDECIDFILNRPDLWRAPDQDAITYLFRGEIKDMDNKFNVRVSDYRKNPEGEECIFHFIADSPRDTFEFLPDRLFFESLRMTPWGTDDLIVEHYEKRLAEKDKQKDVVYKLMKEVYGLPAKKKVFWGIRGDIHSEIMDRIPLKEGDYFVDKNPEYWGNEHMGATVYSPEVLKDEDIENTIVVVTVFRYNEIKPVLESYGFIENKNFFNGKYLLPEKLTYTFSGERENKWDL